MAEALALFAVIGYAFNVSALYVVKSFFPMAMHTALMFLLLAAGILFARPDRGLMKILSADSARRNFPPAVADNARVTSDPRTDRRDASTARADQPSPEAALIVLADTVIFTTLLWWELELLRRADGDDLRRSTRWHQRSSHPPGHRLSAERLWRWTPLERSWTGTPLAHEMFGYSHQEAMGLPMANTILPEAQRREFENGVAEFLKSGHGGLMGRRRR